MELKFNYKGKYLTVKEIFEEECNEVIFDLKKKNKDLEKRLKKQEDKLNFITKYNNYLLCGSNGERYQEDLFIPTKKNKYKIGDYVLYRTIDEKHLKPALIFKIDIYEYSYETRYHIRLENGDEFACSEEWIEGYAKKFKHKHKVLLTRAEKKYLSAVIKPFRDKVDGIYILSSDLEIRHTNNDTSFLPLCFSFAGVKKNKKYTLDELGL